MEAITTRGRMLVYIAEEIGENIEHMKWELKHATAARKADVMRNIAKEVKLLADVKDAICANDDVQKKVYQAALRDKIEKLVTKIEQGKNV